MQLFIYFMLKFSMEILLSESSVVTAHYFQWGTSSVALFLALLGLTVLPVNWVVGSYASNRFQDRYDQPIQHILYNFIINFIVEVCNGPDKTCKDFTILTFIVPLSVLFWNACNNKCSSVTGKC